MQLIIKINKIDKYLVGVSIKNSNIKIALIDSGVDVERREFSASNIYLIDLMI